MGKSSKSTSVAAASSAWPKPPTAWAEQALAAAHEAQPPTVRAAEGVAIPAPRPGGLPKTASPADKGEEEAPIAINLITTPQEGTSGVDNLSLNHHETTYGYAGNDSFTFEAQSGDLAIERTVHGGSGYDTLVFQSYFSYTTVYFTLGKIVETINHTDYSFYSVQFYDIEAIKVNTEFLIMHGNSADNKMVSLATTSTFLQGNGGDDALYGSNHLHARDELHGGSGNDLVHGRIGDDTIYGGANDDTLHGDDGHDYLNGGTGNDTLTGGNGADVFDFDFIAGGTDLIEDFDPDHDRIDLRGWGVSDISELNMRTWYGTTRIYLYDDGILSTLILLEGVTEQQLGHGSFIW